MRRAFLIALLPMSLASPVASQTFELVPVEGLSHSPPAIALGSDGAMWFTDYVHGNINRIDAAKHIVSFDLPWIVSTGLASGSDGNLWLTLIDSVCRVTTAGVITRFPVPTSNAGLEGIASGPDGNLWFVESAANQIGKITPTGVVTEYPIPGANRFPFAITQGPDGAMWFTQPGGGG